MKFEGLEFTGGLMSEAGDAGSAALEPKQENEQSEL